MRPPCLHFEPLQLLNFDFDADPDPAFDFDADPAFHSDADLDPAYLNDADPDPGPEHWLTVKQVFIFLSEIIRSSIWKPYHVFSLYCNLTFLIQIESSRVR